MKRARRQEASLNDLADAIRGLLGLDPLHASDARAPTVRFHQNENPLPIANETQMDPEDYVLSQSSRQGWFGQIHNRRGHRV